VRTSVQPVLFTEIRSRGLVFSASKKGTYQACPLLTRRVGISHCARVVFKSLTRPKKGNVPKGFGPKMVPNPLIGLEGGAFVMNVAAWRAFLMPSPPPPQKNLYSLPNPPSERERHEEHLLRIVLSSLGGFDEGHAPGSVLYSVIAGRRGGRRRRRRWGWR
jgi:hypothetical protein